MGQLSPRLIAALTATAFAVAACGASDEAVPQTVPAATSEPDGCPPADGTETQTREFSAAPPFCLDPDKTYTATVSTNIGELTVELDQSIAPQTVNSFVFLARNQYFDDTVCHRVIQEFVVQCGDPTATGTGGPGYALADELPERGAYKIGSLAMANSGPNTQGSQFFIISGANGAALDPLYSLFGQVAEADLAVIGEINVLGSVDGSGITSSEVRILDVTITES